MKKLKNERLDIKALDTIFDNMVQTMNRSKDDIYVISEQSRLNYEQMKDELEDIKGEIAVLIQQNDLLDIESRKSRTHLATVSKDFRHYSEIEVRQAYENASKLQLELSVNEMNEKQLRDRRDDLERRLDGLLDTIDRADQLVGQVSAVIHYLTSDLKNVGEALEDAKHKQNFAIRIIEAQEEERKRLSRDIHDGPAQMLANVLLRAGLIEKIFNQEGTESAIKELQHLRKSVRSTLIEVRRVIFDLRPMDLDDLGVVPALKKYLSVLDDYKGNVSVHFQNFGQEKRFHPNIEVAVFRLVQESVMNALKHGQPSEVWVKIEWHEKTLNVTVKDNGKGFDVNEVKEKSFGLIGMRERIDLLRGVMKINSTKGKGTIILFQIPLKDKN